MNNISSMRKKHSLALAIALCMAAPLTQAADLNFSGFLSVGGGMVDDENGPAYGGYDEEDLTFDNNLLGLQISGTVSEKLTATVQLTARSENDYEVDAEWAYLSWQATESSKIRAGRLRTPFYMFSDFLDVGYAYSWISPPREVYYLPFNNVNGVDFYTTQTLGIFDTTFQAYFGGFDDELDLNNDGILEEAKTRNQMGIAGTLGKDWWTLRAAYHQADLWIDVTGISMPVFGTLGNFANALTNTYNLPANANKLLVEEDSVTFAEVGLNIDTGRFVAAIEYVEFKPDDALLSKNKRGYAMGGVRFGDWLVHLTASQSKDDESHPEAGIPVAPQTAPLIGALQAVAASQAVDREVISIGTRWDVTTGTALKFQIDDVDDKNQGDQKVFSVALQTVF
ncbi:MAG: porin [Cellvibrio sp.]|uniref:porin n=1 Tax=Cellvibrio sp. TaxID=1965322 RepID=UPI0031B22C74